MPLKKVVKGSNMYQGWVTHTHSHLGGECSHKCTYCYVQKNRFGVSPKYQGKIRILEKELDIKYGSGKTIFIEHMNDMFANNVSDIWIQWILGHCCEFQENTYIFQTKNPQRVYSFLPFFPHNFMIGTTIETNRWNSEISQAPQPIERYRGILRLKESHFQVFVTIEPIMDFDVDILTHWLITLKPDFINIGADSKKSDLTEPSKEKIVKLIKNLQHANIIIKKKTNLERIL